MKQPELMKRIQAGENIFTGKFLGCTIEKSRGEKQTPYESTKIQGPVRNVEFKRWMRKSEKPEDFKPRFNFAVGSVVAVLGFAADLRDGYLQFESTDIVGIEP